nr:DNA-3-methyladenine glycosylase I [Sphingomonas quercus]
MGVEHLEHGSDVDRVANFSEADVERLLQDQGIVRHHGKIAAVINYARRAQELIRAEGSFAAYIWRFEPAAEAMPSPPPRPRRSRFPGI